MRTFLIQISSPEVLATRNLKYDVAKLNWISFLYTFHLWNSLGKQSRHVMVRKASCALLSYSIIFNNYCKTMVINVDRSAAIVVSLIKFFK